MNNKLLTLLGFASKAGRLSFGMDSATAALKAKKSKLILICGDISDKSRKEIIFQSEKYNIKSVLLEFDMQTVSAAVGRSCGILSVNDSKFAEAVTSAIQGGIANDK